MPIRLVEDIQRAAGRRSVVADRDIPVQRLTIEAMTAASKTLSIGQACALLAVSRRTIHPGHPMPGHRCDSDGRPRA